MWDRKELKARGKAAFKANYWKSVLVALILLVFIGGGLSSVSSGARSGLNGGNPVSQTQELEEDMNELQEAMSGLTSAQAAAVTGIVAGAVLIGCLVGFALDVFVINPLSVGCNNFFLVNTREPAALDTLSRGFKPSYGNVVKTMLITDIFLLLWGLLFVIPAIIKSYSYRMVPYILADHPELGGTEVITMSRNMMNGHKWRAFVLDLSFIGWHLLTALTLGILGIFYVGPYVCCTNAELYVALKNQ